VQVGMVACNDYILLECCIYRILKFHFGGSAAYGQLLDLFLEVRKCLPSLQCCYFA
jgi:farnesyl diphosphate synthase